jgi:hypothetical protein
MRKFLLAAVVAVSSGMTGGAVADTANVHQAISVRQPWSSIGLPSQPPTYLAGNSSVLPSQRPAYLSQNDVALPDQRPVGLV